MPKRVHLRIFFDSESRNWADLQPHQANKAYPEDTVRSGVLTESRSVKLVAERVF